MTPLEAASLASLGQHDRRLLAAVTRVALGQATAEDQDALLARQPAETIARWAWRCRCSRADAAAFDAEWARVEGAARTQIDRARALGITPLGLFDPRYPPRLAAIPDPPPLLWVRGEPARLGDLALAIVGSRAATPYGLAMARRLAGDLAAAGMTIVSGLARGVDSAAHAAALAATGRTIGVQGCGLDRVYPAEHRDLARAMERAGAVISEFPPGVPPLPHHFPLRNRIISGLAIAVIVVEAAEKSGALITATTALEQGREVMVVPGAASAGRNRGGHQLVRDGAKLVESADDILQELAPSGRPAPRGAAREDDQLPETDDFSVDEVARRTGESADAALARLLHLELAGRIQRLGGGRFARVLT